jgi:hypothetical protein
MAFPKYQTKELLNKILNSAETAIQVDVVAGAEYAEDSAHTHEDTGNFVLGVRNDVLAELGGDDGDYVPFQMNASGALYVEIASGGSSDAVHVDDAAFTLGTHKGMMMMGFAGTQSVNANDAGAIAMETDGSIHIHDGGNTITVDGTVDLGSTATSHLSEIEGAVETIEGAVDGSQMQVDVVAISAQSDGTYIGDIKFGESLPAGTNNIGDVDVLSIAAGDNNIGNVDIVSLPASTNTIEVVGDVAEDYAAAGNPVLTGGRYDATQRTLDDGDAGALALDPSGALYTREFLGQAGSILVTGTTNAVTTGVTGTKFVAIQFLEDTTFDAGSEGLVASTAGLWPDDNNASTTIDANGGAVTGSEVFPQGMTIFGRWDGFKLDSGKVIAYLGYV